MITIKEALTQKEMTDFVTFPFQLYKNNPYWVPPLIKDELKSFNPKNDIFKSVTARYFLAYQDGKLAGRIAAIINWTEVNTLHKSKVRFGWFDVIDDIEVTKALLDKVIELGNEHKLEYMEGPVGFSNMDKAGMLTEGFDQIATMIGLYNHAYYPEHLKTLGFTIEAEWLEYKIDAKQVDLGKIEPLSRIIEQRYAVKSLNFKSTKDIIPYVDEMFGLLNKTYAELQSFVPIEQFQIDHYKEKYISFIHPDFITCESVSESQWKTLPIWIPAFVTRDEKE